MLNKKLNIVGWILFFFLLSTTTPTFSNAVAADELILVGVSETKTFYTSQNAGNLTWIKAQEYCHQLSSLENARLASFENPIEETLVLNYLAENGNTETGPVQLWMSATDFEVEGDFHWTRSGRKIALSDEVKVDQEDALFHNCLKVQFDGVYFDESCAEHSHPLIWALCESGSSVVVPPTTTPPSTTTEIIELPSPTTTSNPQQPFECTSDGSFPDPFRCDIYHVCVRYQGGYIDYEMTCPEFTNYCPQQQVCGDIDFCPCELKSAKRPFPLDLAKSTEYKTFSTKEDAELIYIGEVEGKSFYTMHVGNLNWIQSMELCHQHGLMMGRIESADERGVLINYLELDYFAEYFWLSGVDYGSEGTYYWFGNGGSVNYAIYGNGGRENNAMYLCECGPIYDWSAENHNNAKMWPLCQTLNSSYH